VRLDNRIQSALHPHGPQADAVATLSWVLFYGGAAILLLIVVLAAYALLAPPERRAWAASQRFVIGGGIVLPLVLLTALLAYTFTIARSIATPASPAAVHIEVIGEQWWWRVHYRDERGGVDFVTANEIRIPAGQPVELALTSTNVLHSFWVPNLAGKLDMIPGRVNRLRLQADHPGVFRGQCAEYCGGPHAKMAFYVIAEEPETFAQWRDAQRRAAAAVEDEVLRHGRTLFLSHCAACHTVRGTGAKGMLGPDLTHVGSRRSLAAGLLPNNAGTLASWISASQQLKPGNLMPSISVLSGAELRALVGYLESLE
jgi:cytochrome c oxidase subunit 2